MRLRKRFTGAILVILAMAGHLPQGLGQGVLHQIDGETFGDLLGSAVSPAGDINADGYADFAVTASLFNGAGKVRVHSGFDKSILYEFLGSGLGDKLGSSLAPAGDVNLDGFVDLVAGAPGGDVNNTNSGTVWVYSGLDGSTLHSLYGGWAGRGLGESVSGAGDVDGDGFDDIIAGAPFDDLNGSWAGSVSVFSGQGGQDLHTHIGGGAFDELGRSVSGAGDINSDGFAEYAAGAEGGLGGRGMVTVYSGQSGLSLRAYLGDAQGDYLGYSMANPGDVDGDGFSDLIVGAPFGGANWNGMARVYSGWDGSTLFTLESASGPDYMLGHSVDGRGDLDGDGFPDLIVGAPGDPGHNGIRGHARVYSGRTGSSLMLLTEGGIQNAFGAAVGGAGDVNADGVPDLIVGAPAGPEWQDGIGTAWIYSGTCGPVTTNGVGCAGSGSFVPALTLTGCPTPGGMLALDLVGGLGGASAFLIIGSGTGSLPFRGCTLLVDPIATILPVALTGNGAGAGEFSVEVTLPMSAVARQVAMQVFIADSGNPGGAAASNGVSFVIQ